MITNKVDNSQIAKAVFYKLNKEGKYEAASRMALGIFTGMLQINDNDASAAIETELGAFGCVLTIDRLRGITTFNLYGNTEMSAKEWEKRCNEIYT